MPQILYFIGLPASGKSTYASKYKDLDYVYLSSDNIREELSNGMQDDQSVSREAFRKMFGRTLQALEEGHNVIYDACNTVKYNRVNTIKNWRKRFEGDLTITAVVFDTPLEVCKERNEKRNLEGSFVMDNNKEIRKVDRNVPVDVLERMDRSLHKDFPSLDDGFDNIEIVKYEPQVNKDLEK